MRTFLMLTRPTATVALVFLAGCAVDSSLRDTMSTTPTKFTSTQSSEAAAECLVRTAQNFTTMFAYVKQGKAPGGFDIQLRSEAGVAVVFEVEPKGVDSSAGSAWVSNTYPFKQSFLRKLSGSCVRLEPA